VILFSLLASGVADTSAAGVSDARGNLPLATLTLVAIYRQRR